MYIPVLREIREVRSAVTRSVSVAAQNGVILEHNERIKASYDLVHAFGSEKLLDAYDEYLGALGRLHEATGIQRMPPFKERFAGWRESRKPSKPLPPGVHRYVRKPPSRDEVLAVIQLGLPIVALMRAELQGQAMP